MFDVNGARSAGYSEDEILQHLTETRQFDIKGALKSGYKKSEIIDYLSKEKPPAQEVVQTQPTQPQGFLDKTRELIQTGAENLGEIVDKPQSFGSKVLQTAGQSAKTLSDIGFEGLKRITPSFIKQPIKKAITAVAETKPVQDVMGLYSSWKQQHPEAAANLEATVNLASVLPGVKGSEVGLAKTAEKIGATGKKLVVSAEKSIAQRAKDYALKLVKPIETQKTKLADVARTTEAGKGIFKKSIIAPTTKEVLMAKAVEKVPGISPINTFQRNYNLISGYSKKLSEELKDEISKSGVVVSKQEVMSNLKKAGENLSKSPLIIGDAKKMADKLIKGAKEFVDKNKGTAGGLLQARKDFDTWVKMQKPTLFDAKTEGALTIANREIRNAFNNLLDKKIPGTGKRLLEQHHLLDAVDVVAPKAAIEANNAIRRAFQKAKAIIGTRNETFNAAAATLGIGGIAAGSAAFAGPAAAIGIPSFLIYKAGKFITKPETKKALGNILIESEKKLKYLTNPIEIKALTEANKELKKYLSEIKPGLTIQDITKGEQPLINEAKKFKSVEEFFNSSKPLYHGGKIDGEIKMSDPLKNIHGRFGRSPVEMTESFSLTPDKKLARVFGEDENNIVSIVARPKKILDLTSENLSADAKQYLKINKPELYWNDFVHTWGTTKKAGDFLKSKGYDAIKIIPENEIGGGGTELRILNKNVLFTKSQLTDIWNKAHGKINKK